MSKAKSVEEVRKEFLYQVSAISSYWASLPNKTEIERCEGVAFSILNILDGCSSLPAFDLLVSPHEDDKQFNIDEGEDYYEDKMMINNCMLHEEFCAITKGD
tara:strand:+ start:40912 stop:41217 length:306 start_codon:yes stop_codon:yes gene_type:complete